MKQYTKQELIDFEKEVIERYKEGNTYGPVHLSGGNEKQLIEIFKQIKDNDWVFTTHRSHYHALLKSGDRDWLMDEIINKAQSSHINSKEYKIFSSAIVGGIIPIALGTALGIKIKRIQNGESAWDERIKWKKAEMPDLPWVYCFVGDMASEMGQFSEAIKYANSENLPITFIIEDNEVGCNTPTREVWKKSSCEILEEKQELKDYYPKIIYYKYKRVYPHYGIGEWILFKDKKVKGLGDYQAEEIK